MTPSSVLLPLCGALVVVVCGCREFNGPKPPALVVSPDSLSFVARAGGLSPPPQYVTISEADAASPGWTASADAPWVGLFSRGDTLPYSLWVTSLTAGMGVGKFTAGITITRPFDGAIRTIPVSLTLLSVAPLAGRWAGAQDSVLVLLTLTEGGGQVGGVATLAPPTRQVQVSGTYATPQVALSLVAPGDTTTLTGSLLDDNSISATLNGTRFGNFKLILYRQ